MIDEQGISDWFVDDAVQDMCKKFTLKDVLAG